MDKRVPVIVNASSGSQRAAAFSADLAARFKSAGVGVEIITAGPAEIVAEVDMRLSQSHT